METRKYDSGGMRRASSTNRTKKIWGYFTGGKAAGAGR